MKILSIDVGIINFAFTFWNCEKLIDFENLENNDWLAVNQYTVIERGQNRRPDVVIFINGLPISVIELKNPAACGVTFFVLFLLPRSVERLVRLTLKLFLLSVLCLDPLT